MGGIISMQILASNSSLDHANIASLKIAPLVAWQEATKRVLFEQNSNINEPSEEGFLDSRAQQAAAAIAELEKSLNRFPADLVWANAPQNDVSELADGDRDGVLNERVVNRGEKEYYYYPKAPRSVLEGACAPFFQELTYGFVGPEPLSPGLLLCAKALHEEAPWVFGDLWVVSDPENPTRGRELVHTHALFDNMILASTGEVVQGLRPHMGTDVLETQTGEDAGELMTWFTKERQAKLELYLSLANTDCSIWMQSPGSAISSRNRVENAYSGAMILEAERRGIQLQPREESGLGVGIEFIGPHGALRLAGADVKGPDRSRATNADNGGSPNTEGDPECSLQ